MTIDSSPNPTPLIVVAAALIDAEGRVLVQRRPPGKPMAGLWEFPGGKLDPGETPEAALCRELGEELGITVRDAALTPAAFASEALGERHLLLLLYQVRDWAGVPEARHATALRWVIPAGLRELAMPPADEPLIGLLEKLV
ncbi:(deoxy)nucleoside triphosphate pyrophosphohydrolase [Sphingomonas turrisvirgatae]|uniref:8-oxo-dGTP diphosphatase n=1 Tax=Sphingomonas turrisvirgatae TaxID=1888892 RepID=A0A1E3LVS1_9SPHN|nr:(deoxy)nucleoside triphosphate pyrophosphohydrolase [Sphingomonas turrisvirgatae]ODP37891.1 NTP pyrophosphohydrolase [Sphingomonas turrisvirgatae]